MSYNHAKHSEVQVCNYRGNEVYALGGLQQHVQRQHFLIPKPIHLSLTLHLSGSIYHLIKPDQLLSQLRPNTHTAHVEQVAAAMRVRIAAGQSRASSVSRTSAVQTAE